MVSLFTPFSETGVFRKTTTDVKFYGNSLSLTQNFYFQQERPEIYSIITLAEPILDITSEIDEEMIKKYNLKWGDTVLIDEKGDDKLVKIYEELESMPNVKYIPGGSAQNSLRVLSWCLNMEPANRDKFKVSMIGSIGDVSYKDKIIGELKDIGVNPIFEVLKDDKTSRCGVGIYKKEKLFATQIRASKRLSEKFIDEHVNEIIAHQALFIEGYMVSNKFDICKKMIGYFVQEKKPIILSLCAPFIVKFYQDKIIELGNEADIICGNMEEAVGFAGEKPKEIEKIFEIIFSKLKPKENRLLVITDGENGAHWGKYNYDEKRLEFIIQYFAIEVKNEDIEDLNGAGDAFLGGFLSKYMKGYSVHDCCKLGIEAATEILKHVGCTFPKDLVLPVEGNQNEKSK